MNQWEDDSRLDRSDLFGATESIPRMHGKYLRYYTHESLIQKNLDQDYKRLWLEKWEFYTQGPNEETKKKGWKLPPKGIIIKSEATLYMEADEDLRELRLKADIQKQKVEALQEIVKAINNRSFLIDHLIKWSQWTGGN